MKHKSKLTSELSEDELLKLIQESDDTEDSSLNYKNNILEFISAYNIKRGKERVSKRIMYALYRAWSINAVTNSIFTTEMTKFFDTYYYRDKVYYLLDKKALKLASETYNLLKTPDKVKFKAWANHFHKFLDYYNIKKGSYYVKDKFVYELYSRFLTITSEKKIDRKPISYKQFIKFCKMYFKEKKSYNDNWFGFAANIKKYLLGISLNKNERQLKELINEENKKK